MCSQIHSHVRQTYILVKTFKHLISFYPLLRREEGKKGKEQRNIYSSVETVKKHFLTHFLIFTFPPTKFLSSFIIFRCNPIRKFPFGIQICFPFYLG